MGSKLFEPLSSQVSIVDEAGKPTAYFTRVLQKISLGPGITATNGILSTATAWGDITGTLSAQTDLQAALNAKANLAGGNSFTGDQTVVGTVTADAVTSYGTMNVGWPDAVHNGSLTLYNTGSAALNLRNVSAPGVYTTMQLFWNGTIGELFVPVGSSFVFRVDTLTFRTGANVSYGSMDSTGLHLTGSATITAANIPVSPGGTTSFLRADGTWATPPSGGGGSTAIPLVPFPLEGIDTNTGSGVGVPAIVLAQYYCQQATPITGLWLPVVSVSVSGLLGYACVYDSGAITSGSASTYVGATKVAATTTAVSIPNTKQMLFIPFSASFTPTVGHIYYVGFSFYNATGTLNLAALAANKKEWFTSGTFNPPPSTLTTMTLSAGTNVGWFGG